MLLRIGGRSADRTYFAPTAVAPVPYGHPIGDQWLQKLRTLVGTDRLRVMLDLNLAVHSPSEAAAFARAARGALPRSGLAALEVGNEPDHYWKLPWLAQERLASTSSATPKAWTIRYSPADYRRDYSSYARALLKAVPGIPIGGPEIASPNFAWLSALEGLGHENPGFLSVHRYGASNCYPKGSPFHPSIPLLLNESAATGLADSVRRAAELAHSRGQALRLTEINSITCGGDPGVADSFATALWAPDALFALVRAGVDSVSWHIRPDMTNAPFHPTPTGIQAMPELYGLAVFADMTRPGARILDASLSAPATLHMKAWVVRFGSNLRVLLINKGPRAANVALHLGPVGTAYARSLDAPGVASSRGVTFGGQSIGSDGRWHGRKVQTVLRGYRGVYEVHVPGFSAVLISAG